MGVLVGVIYEKEGECLRGNVTFELAELGGSGRVQRRWPGIELFVGG